MILRSPLPRAELTRRLHAHVSPGWAVFSGKPVMGHVGEGHLWLRMRGTVFSRNSMQPYLYAHLSDDGGGTRLDCRFKLHPVTLAFFVAWLLMLVFVFRGMDMALSGPGTEMLGGMAPVVLVAVAAAAAGIILTGRYFARNDRAALLQFLKDEVGAE